MIMNHMYVILLALLYACTIHKANVYAGSLKDMNDLYSDLMDPYNKNVLPRVDTESSIRVNISFGIICIQEFNEVDGKFAVMMYFIVKWIDTRLIWKGWDYNNTYTMRFPQSEVWRPPITITNPYDSIHTLGQDFLTITYGANGLAYWGPGDIVTSVCSVDVTNFPFDTQICLIKFNCWGYLDSEIQLRSISDKVATRYYFKDGTWDLIHTNVITLTYFGVSNVYVYFHLRRRPEFAVATILSPILCVLVLNILVFVLPTDCGERVSFSITTLLALAVFLSLVTDNLPKTSDPMSILSYFLIASLLLSTYSSFMTIISVQIYYISEDSAVPLCVQSFVRLCYCVKAKKKDEKYVATENIPDLRIKENGNNTEVLEKLLSQRPEVKWPDVSKFIDKCMILFNSVAMVAIVVAFCMITLRN